MESIAIGLDISKGRCDVAILNQSGTLLAGSGGYDDTRRDHERLRDVLMSMREKWPEVRIVVGKKKTRLSYEQIGGKLKAHAHYEASNKRRVQGVVIGLPGNRRRSLVDDELKRKFAGVVRSDHPRRKAGGKIAGGI